MHLTMVHVQVKPEHVDEFIAATRLNHDGSIREQGNLRFDVLQSEDDSTRFLLQEVFASPEAAAEHKTTPHYLEWRETVADWMASPRDGKRYRVLAPEDVTAW
jgi:autoinducer 2-degrading protein